MIYLAPQIRTRLGRRSHAASLTIDAMRCNLHYREKSPSGKVYTTVTQHVPDAYGALRRKLGHYSGNPSKTLRATYSEYSQGTYATHMI